MKTLKILLTILSVTLCVSLPVSVPAQESRPEEKTQAAVDMTEGEVRKVDKDNKKITIKHGEIKNLDMPGMTMVFRVNDPVLLDTVKAGDKVKFRAEKAGGTFVITEMVPNK